MRKNGSPKFGEAKFGRVSKMEYNPSKIESKWQKRWQKQGLFRTPDKSKKPKFYVLDMFPYPSAEGIHVGHMRGYTFSDVIAKKKMMEGYNVLHPMGWDAFGLPAENYALKTGIHPKISTRRAIKNIKKQLLAAGYGYDWQREISSMEPEYYKWTQWFFLQLYKKGLAYQKQAAVNWCPSCQTVLANEQVIDGFCERCHSRVEKKYLKQWFFKITKYAERLLNDLEKIDWPEKIKVMQRNWIGKSEGTEIKFQIVIASQTKQSRGKQPVRGWPPDFVLGHEIEYLDVFTTRVDTLFGCTYVVIAPEHHLIKNLNFKIKNWPEVKKYIEEAKKKTEIERTATDKEKTGVELKGIKAINPVNNQAVPIFVADYVLMEYGTGAIMAVPAHDQRDFVFAQKHNLPMVEVIIPQSQKFRSKAKSNLTQAFEEDGVLINSAQFSGLFSAPAREKITQWLESQGQGRKLVCYKLRDWLISRQRYWGAPIPMIYCQKCGQLPVPEKDLPVQLPALKDFKPTGTGESPLAKSAKFVQVKCPKCRSQAKRETDTMDTFVCSSWYYLRYISPKLKDKPFDKLKAKQWLPVDLYIGGAEHAVLHLLYARFLAKFMFDQKLIDFDEPFTRLFNQGTIYRQGAKMSKSKGNVVNPDDLIRKFGADTLRLYELFMGPADQATEWQDKGVIGCYRFLQKVWKLKSKVKNQALRQARSKNLEKLIHQTIKKVTDDIENFRFNTAVSALMILANQMEQEKEISNFQFLIFNLLLAPFVPHIAEELWRKLGRRQSIFRKEWPKYDPELVKEETFELVIQINGKARDKVEVSVEISRQGAKAVALKRDKVKKWLEGKEIKKVIFVPRRLINIVT